MLPTSPASPHYYLAINSTPNGPHTAAGVLQLLQQGTVNATTLICREGGPSSDPAKMASVEYTPWFYVELGLPGLATVIGFSGGGQRRT